MSNTNISFSNTHQETTTQLKTIGSPLHPLPSSPSLPRCPGASLHCHLKRHLLTKSIFTSAPILLHKILPTIEFSLRTWLNEMSDADSECWSDNNFPPLLSLVKICLNVKPDKNDESSHLGNRRSIAKIKMNLSKAMDKNKPSPRVTPTGALKKKTG